MSSHDNQNVWFGVAMFLLGVIAGTILVFTLGSGIISPLKNDKVAPVNQQQQKQVPAVSVTERMAKIVDTIGIDADAFASCATSDKYNTKISDQTSGGQAAGVSGTPGNIVYDLKSKKAILVSGAQPFESFKTVIDGMLKDAKSVTGTEAKNVVPVDFDKDHVRGTSKAKIAVIEYSDYQCPYCQKVHPTYQKIVEAYGDDVVWVFRHFPLSFHPEAMPLAVGSECAAELGGNDAFWEYTDAVFQ